MTDEFHFDWRKYPEVIIILMIAAAAISWYAGRMTFKADSDLLQQYEASFIKCKSACQMQDLIGYIRQINEMRHQCFCYNWTDNSMRETPNANFLKGDDS